MSKKYVGEVICGCEFYLVDVPEFGTVPEVHLCELHEQVEFSGTYICSAIHEKDNDVCLQLVEHGQTRKEALEFVNKYLGIHPKIVICEE